MPIDDPCPCTSGPGPGGSSCVDASQPHTVTGWCADGVPVIVVYTLDCSDPPATGPTVLGIYDAETGAPTVGPIRPCGERDWEVAQWCDTDEFGEVISAYIVIFQWDEVTQSLTSTTTLPDGVTPYVPTGTPRQCEIGSVTVDGFVTVVNAAGAAAVNIQDGGNSITVDGPLTDAELRATPVPVSGTVSVTEPVSVDDNGGSLTVDGSVTAIAQPGVDIGDVTVNNGAGAAAVNIQDGGNSITVDGSVSITPVDSTTSAVGVVFQSTVSVPLFAANAARKMATVYNFTTARLFLKLGGSANLTTSFTVILEPDDYYEVPLIKGGGIYTGAIDGIWDAAGSGTANTTELT